MSANPNLKQVSPASLDEIATRFNLLSDVEKQLPDDRRAGVIRSKLSVYFKRQEQLKAAQANAAANGTAQQPISVDGAAGNAGPARPLVPPQAVPNGGNVPVNMAQQQQHMQGGPPGGAQMGQSPRVGQMPQGQQQQQQQQQQPMNPGQQQAYQEQMRLQQQHQQQAHLSDMMQKTQRMQQQQKQQIQAQAQQVIANQQQQQNGTMMPPQHPNVAGHSPPNPAMVGSPHTNIGRSPSNPPRQTSTPVPTTNPAIRDQTKILMDNFPKLLELKRQGRLAAEQEKLFDSLMSSEAGRAHLSQISAREANAVIQNNLQNPIGHQQPTQMPQQMSMPTPQQQLAQLQAQQQAMGMQGFPQGFIPNQQQQQQQQQQQLAAQQMQQMQFRQLAASQQQQHQQQQPAMRPPNPAQAQQLANATAQQARQQLMAAAAATREQQQMAAAAQPLQQQHLMDQQQGGTPNYGSPRPNAPPQPGQANGGQRATMNQVQQTMLKLQQMSEGQRETYLQQHPRERQFWDLIKNSTNNQINGSNAQHAQVARAQNQTQAGSPNIRPAQAANANGSNFTGGNMSNLHIPINKQRNIVQQQQQPQQAGSPAAGTPPMRPPMPQQNPRDAAVQRMINQGIPVNAAGGRAPGGPEIKPFMLLQQMKAPPTAESIHPGAIRQTSDQIVPQLDRSGSLLAKVTWAPSEETDAQLRAKLSDFRRPLKPLGRSTLSSGFGVSRVIGDVVLEQMPEGFSAMAEDAEGMIAGDKKKAEEVSGLPGQKKRKISELARTVDDMLEVDPDVEMTMLQIADEHIELVSNLSCMLSKHRKGDAVDRKDIQLAYEMIESRTVPGFSSDVIRLDQAKYLRRTGAPVPPARANKLKLVQDARANWRKDKLAKAEAEKARLEAEAAGLVPGETNGDGDVSMDSVDPTSAPANGATHTPSGPSDSQATAIPAISVDMAVPKAVSKLPPAPVSLLA